MQIKELVLYGKNGQKRSLVFNLGRANIIVGESKTGKSSLADIIEYCLGGTKCNIADGVIRENVAWYGLLLKFDSEQLFVARENPPAGQQSTGSCYYEVRHDLSTPGDANFTSNIDVDALESLLSDRIGITDNLNTPAQGQSRMPLSANIRHALFYCFQNQDEIAARGFVFHRQTEEHITQAIRDTLPYFLGAVDQNSLALEAKRAELRREISIKRRTLEEAKDLQGGGPTKGKVLIAEAQEVGILSSDACADSDDFAAIQSCLATTSSWSPSSVHGENMDKLSSLQNDLSNGQTLLEQTEIDLQNARSFADEEKGYLLETRRQKARLDSIGLFKNISIAEGNCPLCSSPVRHSSVGADSIRDSLRSLDTKIGEVSKDRPSIRRYVDGLEEKRRVIANHIREVKAEIEGVYEQKVEAQSVKDLNSRQAQVVGRISLWLESVQPPADSASLEKEIKTMEERILEIDALLSPDTKADRLQSILNRISVDMSAWARELDLENPESPYRLDIGRATVVVDKPDRPVPLKQMGSASNWVGIHLIAYFALHKYFVEHDCAVPHFLVLDQPSQVYFPSPTDTKEVDLEEVKRLYSFIFRRVSSSKGNLQVIVVDHADLEDMPEFRNHIIERWRDGNKLIPMAWLR